MEYFKGDIVKMVYTDSIFYRRIDKNEKFDFDESGNIQMHNGVICRNFENIITYDSPDRCNNDFIQMLQKAIVKNELSRSPILPSIIMDVFALLFILICLSLKMNINQILIFILLPAAIMVYFTCSIIKESIKLNRALKCVKQGKNVFLVSVQIDGTRLFTDNSGDVSKDYYYVCSDSMLICVPKDIYDLAGPGSRLIGAVVGTGKHKMFYTLSVS